MTPTMSAWPALGSWAASMLIGALWLLVVWLVLTYGGDE